MSMFDTHKIPGLLLAVVMLCGSAASPAAIVFPALEINALAVVSNASGLTMNGQAPVILSDASTVLIDLVPDLSFSLTSDAAGSGSLSVDGGAALSATFSNLAISHIISGLVSWNADLTYIGGSLAGGLTAGRLEGTFVGISGFGTGVSLLGKTFTGNNGIAKLGAVGAVPVPSAVWLFGSGLLGMAGIARRSTRS